MHSLLAASARSHRHLVSICCRWLEWTHSVPQDRCVHWLATQHRDQCQDTASRFLRYQCQGTDWIGLRWANLG
jgi:hypothetical protein